MQKKPLILALLAGIALSGAAQADLIYLMIYDADRNLTWLADNSASQEPKNRWIWMGNYRVWEANRKVFLFPENWLSPELHDDKYVMASGYHADGGMTWNADSARSVYGPSALPDWDFTAVIAIATHLSSQDKFADANAWSGTEFGYAPDPNYAWYYDTYGGNRNAFNEDNGFYVWAVRPGDVAAVPEPATLALLGLGLAGLGAMRRRG